MEEKTLKQALKMISDFLEEVPDGLFAVDLQGRILTYNQRFCSMWEIPETVLTEGDARKVIGYISGKLQFPEEFSKHGQTPVVHQAGRPEILTLKDGRFFEQHSSPLRISGDLEGSIWHFRDVTEMKRTEMLLKESDERYRSIFDSAAFGIINVSRGGNLMQVNGSFCDFLGYPKEALLKMNIMDVTHPEDHRKTLWGVQDSRSHQRVEIEKRYIRKDGSVVWGKVSSSWIMSSRGEYSVAMIQDITKRKRAETEIEKSLSLLHATLESTADGILAVDKFGKNVILYNDQFLKMWKVPESVLEEIKRTRDDTPLLSYNTSQVRYPEEFVNKVKALYSDPTKDSFDIFELKDGRVFERHSKPQMVGNENIGRVWSFRDITDRAHTEQHLKQLANFDSLTGLPNRTLLFERFERAMARADRTSGTIGVLFLDLDRFKNINDTLGHDFGDRLLREVTERLSGCVREGDTMARLGGDEFIFLRDNVENAEEISLLAQKILEALSPPFNLAEHEIFISGSIGIAVYPRDGRSFEQLLKNADTAMYRAKDQGKNNFQVYSPLLNARASDRLTLENRLRRAVERNEFVLHYQPILDIATGSIVSLEALVRWLQPDRGLVPLEEFVLIAEETGLMIPLGNWVLRSVCRQIGGWQAAGVPQVAVAVNISGRQLQQNTLVNSVAGFIRESGIPPGRLELEFTESGVMRDPDVSGAILAEVNALGVKTSLDNFGTGLSTLAYLKHFRFSCLKIDRVFVGGIPDDPADKAVVRTMIDLAHGLNLAVVAEGVETKEQFQFFKSLRCEKAQGAYLSAPLSEEEITHLLVQGKKLK